MIHLLRFGIVTVFALLISVNHLRAQASPLLTAISPQGGQRGTELDITLDGTNIANATALLFSGDGISAQITERGGGAAVLIGGQGVSGRVSDNNRLYAHVTLSPTASLESHKLRVVTPNGVSTARNFVVGDLPEIGEMEPNSARDTANEVSLPSTVSGVISSVDDTDFYRFAAKKGMRLICDALASRMGSPLDSFLSLYGPDGAEIASNDIGNGLDAFVDYTIPADGTYTVQIRDLQYRGDGQYFYRLSLGELPYLESLFPIGGRRGTENSVSVGGRNLVGVQAVQVSVAKDAPLGARELRVATATGRTTNARPFMVGDLPEATEGEPNNERKNANPVTAPVTVNGNIGEPNDRDWYTFRAEKGQRLTFEIVANRLGSHLDAFLTLYGSPTDASKGEPPVLAVNDDAVGAEARIEHQFVEAGDYSIAVRDLSNGGGANFPYRLTITPPRPDFRLSVSPADPVTVNGVPDGEIARIHRGGSIALLVDVTRLDGFTGALRFACKGLPEKFDVSPTALESGQAQALLTLTAPMDAPTGMMWISVIGIGAIGEKRAERESAPILLSVIEKPRFRLEVAEPALSVLQDKDVAIHVTAIREAGFTAPIALSVVGLPTRSTFVAPTIPEGQTGATVTLRAWVIDGRTDERFVPPAGDQYITLKGTATAENEPVSQTTAGIPLRIVEAPFVVTVMPVRQGLVLPAESTEAEDLPTADKPAAAEAQAAPVNGNGNGSSEGKTVDAVLTLKVMRQGGFTDAVNIVAVNLPEGLTAADTTIPANGTEAKVTLKAAHRLKTGSYDIKFTGRATINGRQFEQDTSTVTVKILR